jgi:transcriptional regulator with XRE-family HTH domain
MSEGIKSASSAKTGKIFLDSREELGLTSQQVSEQAVMNIKYIEGIESGDYSIFPSEGFARAYFIKYQKFLSLDCKFPSIYEPENRQAEIVEKSIARKNRPIVPFITGLGIIISLLIWNIIFNKFFYYDDDKLDIVSTSNNFSLESAHFIEASILNSKKELIIPIVEFESRTEPNSKEDNELSLLFTNECWVEVYSNDELIEYQLFQAGDEFNMQIEEPFRLVIGNAESITGSYKGNLIDFITNANRLRVNTIIFNDE